MTPGDKSPGRYRKTTLSVAVAGLIAAGASAPVILSQFLDEREGVRLTSYADGKKIWTVCRGLTRIDGQPVTPGMKFTKAECDKHDQDELKTTLAELDALVKVPLSEPAKAGIASWCTYNIGATQCRKSTMLRLLNEGKRNDACAQITLWIRDNGKDCRIRASNCYGQIERRPNEDEMCLITTGEPTS